MSLERLKQLPLRAVFGAAHLALRASGAPLPDWGARPHRVLFLRHDKIGDMVMSTGIVRAIAESHPTVTVDVLASSGNVAVLAEQRGAGEVLVFDGVTEGEGPRAALRAARALRARRYDAVVDGLVLTPYVSAMSRMLLAACGAPRRIGMRACGDRPRVGAGVYTHPIDPPAHADPHHVDYLARLAGPFGVAPEAVPAPALQLSPAEAAWAERAWQGATGGPPTGPRLLVNISAGHRRRRWSDAQFSDAIRYVRAAHAGVTAVIICDPSERSSAERIARETGAAAPATPGVRAAFALVARADGVLTPDTAVAHAASAFGKPCVTLMLAEGAEPFVPYRTRGVVVKSAGMEMTQIPVGEVALALDRLFALLGAGERPTVVVGRHYAAPSVAEVAPV